VRARSMQHAAGGEDADRRTRGLSLPCRAAYTVISETDPPPPVVQER